TVAPVAAVRFSYRGDVGRVRAGGEPVEHLGADRTALAAAVGGRSGARLAGHQQHQPRSYCLGLDEPRIEPGMRLLERMAVQVEREVGRERRTGELALPRGVEAILPELGSGRGTAG